MIEKRSDNLPLEINLHRKSRILSIRFSDGKQFDLPCEYLRVFSKAAEVRTMGHPETGKENVNIDKIEPQGQYAVRLVFDDGHDTGIYSWSSLYELGKNQERNWADYLKKLDAMGYMRNPDHDADESGKRSIKVLYFAYLVRKMGKEAEALDLPDKISDIRSLLEWLRQRDSGQARFLADADLNVTVNKQFSEPFTKLHDGDEVALVPNAPTPPAGV